MLATATNAADILAAATTFLAAQPKPVMLLMLIEPKGKTTEADAALRAAGRRPGPIRVAFAPIHQPFLADDIPTWTATVREDVAALGCDPAAYEIDIDWAVDTRF